MSTPEDRATKQAHTDALALNRALARIGNNLEKLAEQARIANLLELAQFDSTTLRTNSVYVKDIHSHVFDLLGAKDLKGA